MAEEITSAANPIVKRMRLLAERKHRRRGGAFVVQGIQPVWCAVEAGWDIEALIIAPELLAGSPAEDMVERQSRAGVRVIRMGRDLFVRVSDRDGPSGLAAIVRSQMDELGGLRAEPGSVFVALHGISNPGNLGTIVRCADATGARAVVLVGDTTDPFAPAAVKASMGSLFGVRVARARGFEEFFAWASSGHVGVVAASGSAVTDHWSAVYRSPLALLLGSEGRGLPDSAIRASDQQVRIPMVGTAESLNVAAAAAVLMYEVNRQRQTTRGGRARP
jgi:TrmH family RNA methyltransferase